MKYDYNLMVIGAGSGGLVAAYIAVAVKAKVALVEEHKMGGDCLNTGCVPSKALIRTAKILSYAKRHKDFGIKEISCNVDFQDVMARVKDSIARIEPHDSVERYTKLGVECINGTARITGPHSVQVGGKTFTARRIIVATGAKPLLPNIKGLSETPYLTSDTLWDLKECPKRLVVLGGGPIGCEMAQAFARLGAKVTIIEREKTLLSREDKDVSQLVTQAFEHENIDVLTAHTATEVKSNELLCEHNSQTKHVLFDNILVALGRQANVTGFGLEELSVELNPNGTIKADPILRTNIPSIYVCGDVTGPYQFTHAAAHQAWHASINALFGPFKTFKADYRVIPHATFTDPEAARVGLNEKEAKAQNIPYEVTTYGLDDLDRAIVESEAKGFVKVLTPPGKDKILGVTIVGHHAADIIAEFVLAMKHGLGLNKILGTIHIYPTLAEANKFAAGAWRKAHTPPFLMKMLKIFHRLRR